MKEKIVKITKGKNKVLENKWKEGHISRENLALFFQISGNVKHEIITRDWTYKLPHILSNNLGLMVLGNEEILRLFNWFLNSWTNND